MKMKLSKCIALVTILIFIWTVAPAKDKAAAVTPAQDHEKMTLSALGDLLLFQKVSVLKDSGFTALVDLIRNTDCTWANCEIPLIDPRKTYPEYRNGDIPCYAEPWTADEFKWMGIDLVGFANNHTLDYGIIGLFSTLEQLYRVGIGYAGAGKDLEDAAKPRYIVSSGGTIGQVNCAGSFHPGTWASSAHPYMNGRPGLNPLRVDQICKIDKQTFDTLKKSEDDILKYFGEDQRGDQEKKKEQKVVINEITFVPGEKFDFSYVINEADLKRLTEAIKAARRNSRIVIASLHEHRGAKQSTMPAPFIETYARACIDAGADVFFNTGPHRPWGIEIYKNKPIFYSLGNFFFLLSGIQHSAEKLAEYGLDPFTLDSTLLEEKIATNYFKDDFYWDSFVPIITFGKENEVLDIKLYPITLGKDQPLYKKGIPRLADEKKSKAIIDELKKMSEPYKTKIDYSNSIGTVHIK